MSNKKQTAVEWIYEQIDDKGNVLGVYDFINQAKEMEKEQIIDAYKADLYPCSDEDAEQYYKETYEENI